jgi:hypothetical protein
MTAVPLRVVYVARHVISLPCPGIKPFTNPMWQNGVNRF